MLFIQNHKVNATFEISNFDIECFLFSNGDLNVEENITYYTNEEKNEIKVFTPFESNIKTVTYKYTLKNLATKYFDTGEIYWDFTSSEWTIPIKNLTINIFLPNQESDGEVYVFGYGSNEGTFIKNANCVTLNTYDIAPYNSIKA